MSGRTLRFVAGGMACVLGVGCVPGHSFKATFVANDHHTRLVLGDAAAESCLGACRTGSASTFQHCLAGCPGARTLPGACDPADRPPLAVCAQAQHVMSGEGACDEKQLTYPGWTLRSCDDDRRLPAGILLLIIVGAIGAVYLVVADPQFR